MPSRPSEPVLALIRATLRERELNVAAFAEQVGEKRSLVKRVLAGKEPLTVDQLMTWTQSLGLGVEELAGGVMPEEPKVATLGAADLAQADEDDSIRLSPYGLHAEQAIKMAFAMSVDFAFVSESAQLKDSGVPPDVLARFPERMLIRLDAAYHKYNAPQYDDFGLTLTLSFDTIYTCVFPWSSVLQVTLYCEPPDPQDAPQPDPEPEPEPESRPTLRLIK
ncbi:MAG: hypothetical protein VX899_00450 [Myxococcota bacterium]|nr:hypothetical protein [Myxococcota bacterium]